ncbi:hypothetical protein M3Y94_01280800 [Aphelenchoides besseyi]|nr:hypothetical protein M3Y94_01280800 [Aphelenchoides besseyi]
MAIVMSEQTKLFDEVLRIIERDVSRKFEREIGNLKSKIVVKKELIVKFKHERDDAHKKIGSYNKRCKEMRAQLNVLDSSKRDQEFLNRKLQMEIQRKDTIIERQRAWIERLMEEQLMERNGLDVRLKPEKPDRNRRF